MLIVRDLKIETGPRVLIERADFSVQAGDRMGLVGRNGAGYERSAVNTFLQRADYYLVGAALTPSHTLVTPEVPSRSQSRSA